MNLIDVPSIVANIMFADSLRSNRLVEQKSEQNAEITAYQALNTSLLQVADAAEAITGSTSWVPASISSSDASVASAYASGGAVAGASPYPFTVTTIVEEGSDTATITYTKNDALQTVTSSSNTFTGLADFPGMTITVSATGGPVTLTPSATTVTGASVMTSAVSSLVTKLNNSLALITSQISASGSLDTDYTPRDISQRLLNTSWDDNTLTSLANAGIELTRVGTFTYNEATLTTALAGGSAALIIGEVAAFAARVENVTTSATSVTGTITREINTRQSRVSDLSTAITDLAAYLTRREESLTVYYSQLNATIQALQNQQSYLQTQLDVFTKALTVNR